MHVDKHKAVSEVSHDPAYIQKKLTEPSDVINIS